MILAVGFFDGVHLGHQEILRGADAALTFRNHPLSVLAPELAPRLLMRPEDRFAAIRNCGVAEVVALDFTPELAALSPAAFLDRLSTLVPLEALSVRCGANWHFGAGGTGDAAFLRSRGIGVTVVPFAEYRGERISSTRIRSALESGDVTAANAMLGRAFAVSGTVFRGKGEGSNLGFPTVNLRPANLALKLPFGVYAVRVGDATGVANYGLAPTMGPRAWTEPTLEIHFPDGAPDGLAAESVLSVSLLRFVRPERTFASAAELQRQIAEDVKSCRA
jgi:riboflavin kinase / FMN adenylyltransferase